MRVLPRSRNTWLPGTLARKRPRQLCHYPALLSADDSGDDDLVTASACPRSSQSSQSITGVTAGGGTLRLLRLIRVLRSIRGTGMHQIHHAARIHHGNVTEAADVPVTAPSPRLVAYRPSKRGPHQLCQRLARPPHHHGSQAEPSELGHGHTVKPGWAYREPVRAEHRTQPDKSRNPGARAGIWITVDS